MEQSLDFPEQEFNLALSLAVGVALRHSEPEPFFQWFRRQGVELLLKLMGAKKFSDAERKALATVIGRTLWNALPRPELGYRLHKLPELGRNDFCPCGSGRKYKQCCGVARLGGFEFTPEMLLPMVLQHVSKKDLAAFPPQRFAPELVAHIASGWAEADQDERARVLLETLFAPSVELDERHEYAFDVLMNVYLALGKPRKRKDLLARCLAVDNRILRSAAQQRLAAILMDEGDRDGAWAAFNEALRLNPEEPRLSFLELSLLQAEGNTPQIRERAKFWLARLRRRSDAHELADHIEYLEATAKDPGEFSDTYMAMANPILHELAGLIEQWPPVKKPPKIETLEDGAGIVHESLGYKALARWEDIIDKGSDPELIHRYLREQAHAWDSPTVLSELLRQLREVDAPEDWSNRALFGPLYGRVRAVLDAALDKAKVQPRLFEWGWHENRPLLATLYGRMDWLRHAGQTEEALLACRELLAWCPEDNMGVRLVYSELSLKAGDYEVVARLSEQYPDDFAALQYDRALALFALDRGGEALVCLRDAHHAYPRVLKQLLAARPKRVKPDRFGMEIGGEYEASLYRVERLPVWERTGALAWARAYQQGPGRRR